MASPFPGMDPYLEQFWGDVHHALITYARDQLQPEGQGILSEGDCKFVDKTLVSECGLRSIDRTPSANRHGGLCHHEFHAEVRRTVSDVIGRFGRPLVEATLNVLGLPAPFPLLSKRSTYRPTRRWNRCTGWKFPF